MVPNEEGPQETVSVSSFVASQNGLAIHGTRDGGRVRLSLGKELEWRSVTALEKCVADQLSQDFTELIVDLSDLTFIDSTGIKALVDTARQVAGLGRRFLVVNPNGRVLKIFEVTAMESILRYWQAQADARTGKESSTGA